MLKLQTRTDNAVAFHHLLFSNLEIIDFCQCADITHCLTAKFPIAVSKKSYRGLLRVNQKRKVSEVCVVSTVEF